MAAVSGTAVGYSAFTSSRLLNPTVVHLFAKLAEVLDIYEQNTSELSLYPNMNVLNANFTLWDEAAEYRAIMDKFTDAGLGLPVVTNSTSKRFSNAPNNRVLHLHWKTGLGRHTAIHMPHISIHDMVDDIIDQFASGYSGTYQYMRNTALKKRTERYQVDWVSYNVDNENADLERGAWNKEPQTNDWENQLPSLFFGGRGLDNAWKWCGTVMDSDDSNYDSFGNVDATHGEIYTNQYGDIDDYCNDNKGGARCADEGCG